MHADMEPLAPLSDANRLMHIISVDVLHMVCIVSGVIGLVLMYAVFRLRRRAT